MKNKGPIPTIVILVFLLLSTYSCQKDEIKIVKEQVSGLVQKGPFINGTTILMSELNSSLEQTGNVYSTQIIDNKGSFEINNVSLSSSYVEFSANGFYFNEIAGGISEAPLNLFAISDITDISTVNVNILTHLEKRRVEYITKEGENFIDAKETTQREIISIFGFENSEMKNSESLDISVDTDDNAILLAISIILQGNRSVGDLTELLASISTDIFEDGILDDKDIMHELRFSSLQLNFQSIRQNLVERYQSLGISSSIPNFEKYILDFLSFTATNPTVEIGDATSINLTSATLNAVVFPNNLGTVVTFEYGLTSEYGNSISADQSPVSGSISTNVSAEITGLSQATVYHFRIKAENDMGIAYSSDMVLTTLIPDTWMLNGGPDMVDGKTWVFSQVAYEGDGIYRTENPLIFEDPLPSGVFGLIGFASEYDDEFTFKNDGAYSHKTSNDSVFAIANYCNMNGIGYRPSVVPGFVIAPFTTESATYTYTKNTDLTLTVVDQQDDDISSEVTWSEINVIEIVGGTEFLGILDFTRKYMILELTEDHVQVGFFISTSEGGNLALPKHLLIMTLVPKL